MKIIGVYESRNAEGDISKEILVWPDSVMIRSGKPLFLPDEGDYYIHQGVCVRIDAVGKTIDPKFARRYYSEKAPIAFIFPEKVSDCIEKMKNPQACDIVADYSVICGDFITTADNSDLDIAIANASVRNTLKTGDIVATIDRERIKAERNSVLKISLEGKTLIENKLK